MAALLAVITIGIDPTIDLGPITIAWHGLTIAIGIVIGGIAVGTAGAAPGASNRPGHPTFAPPCE